MNREIKFRCWDTENKQMLDVQELDWQDSYDGQPMIRTTMYNDYFDTEDVILMQYTGLKDKNGKEIYEGDIVKSYYYIDTPDGEQERYNKKVIKYNDVLCEYNIDAFENIEVIGNIYENPELVEEGE